MRAILFFIGIVGFFVLVGNALAVINTGNLVSYYPMGNTTDLKSGYNLTNTSAQADTTTGKYFNAYQFNAVDSEYMILPSSWLTKVSGDNVGTLSFWVYADSAQALATVWSVAEAGVSANRMRVSAANGNMTFFTPAITIGHQTNTTAGSWYHVAVLQNGTSSVWINGVKSHITDSGEWLNDYASLDTARIGARSFALDSYYDGKIDELAYWNTSLTPSEIVELYNSGNGSFYCLETGTFITGSQTCTNTTETNTFTITATDRYDSNAINTFNATITSSNVNATFTTTNGTVYLTPLTDMSGNGNDATNNGATYNSTAEAYEFDGTSYLNNSMNSIPSTFNLSVTVPDVTNTGTTQYIISARNISSDIFYLRIRNTFTYDWSVDGLSDSYMNPGNVPADGDVINLYYNGTHKVFYLNGVAVLTETSTGTPTNWTTGTYLGDRDIGGAAMTGSISDFSIINLLTDEYTIQLPFFDWGNQTINATVEADNYFTNTTSAHNTSTNYAASLFQAQVTFNADEILSGDNVTSFTVSTTSNGGSATATDTNPTLYLKGGTYNITFNKTGWFNKTYTLSFGNQTTTSYINCSSSLPGCSLTNDGDWNTNTNTTGLSDGTYYVYKNYTGVESGFNATFGLETFVGTASGAKYVEIYNYTSAAWENFITPTASIYTNYSALIPSTSVLSNTVQFRTVLIKSFSQTGMFYESNVNGNGNFTQNLSGVYQTILNITATNNVSGASVASFNLTINSTNFTYQTTSTTTNGSVQVPWVAADTNVNITFSAAGYATTNHIINVSGTGMQNYTLSVFTSESILFYFRDEQTNNLIDNLTVTVYLTSAAYSTNFTTDNGTYYIDLLTPADYTITYSAPTYAQREYLYTVNDDSTTTLTLYLLNESVDDIILVNVLDTASNRVENATVTLQKKNLTGTNYYVVEECLTDALGQCLLHAELYDVTYRFLVAYDSVTRFNSGDTKISSTEIFFLINIEATPLTTYSELNSIEYSLTNTSTIITYVWDDAYGNTQNACLITRYRVGAETTIYNQTCDASASGTITQSFNSSLYDEWIAEAYIVTEEGQNYLLDTLSIVTNAFKTNFGRNGLYLFGFGVVITMIFSSLFNPVMPVVVGAFGVFVMNSLGFISLGVKGTIAVVVIAVIMIYLLRRT